MFSRLSTCEFDFFSLNNYMFSDSLPAYGLSARGDYHENFHCVSCQTKLTLKPEATT